MTGRGQANPRRSNGSKRDKLRARVYAEESACWLCGGPVDKTLGLMPGVHSRRCLAEQRDCTGCVYHPMSPTLDEVVPVSQGGSPYDRSNVRLAHRQHNRDRGDGTRTAVAAPTTPLVTSRAW